MHRLGRRPARHTGQSRRSKVVMGAHLGGLGAAPAQTNDYIAKVTVPWRMMLNDQVGDCMRLLAGTSLEMPRLTKAVIC